MKNYFTILLIVLIAGNYLTAQPQITRDELTVFDKPHENMMRDYLTALVDKYFDKRDSLLSDLRSKEDWASHAQVIRDSMVSWTGMFPEKTPLNARITGRLESDEYTVEKILFESRPNYLVSANLYLPKNITSPRPALLNVIGHTPAGKADERYQYISISMAKKGFVVLTIDGLGQGERVVKEYSEWGSPPGNTHQILGIKSFLVGTHVFNLMVWDAIRAIDYLVSRDEVDPQKIGITGSSGGGMMSTYILPFEDRISISVPTCNPNTWRYRVYANLGTDHEQVFFGAFEAGIDPRGDLLFAHVPKPLLLNTTNEDHLNPLQGVWELNTWLYKAYSAHNSPEKISTTMVNAGHAYNHEQREITYSWLLRWTGNDASKFSEGNIILEKEKDLNAAIDGSVFNEQGSLHPYQLVLDYYETHKSFWPDIKTEKDFSIHKKKMAILLKEVLHSGFENNILQSELSDPRISGDIQINPFTIELQEGIILPGIILNTESGNSKDEIILYLHEDGKQGIINDWDIVTKLLKAGYKICAVDLRGMGETASVKIVNYFWDFLSGEPIFSQRVGDILSVVKWLKGHEAEDKTIKLWGKGMCALYGSFAGLLCDDISSYLLEEPLISFESIVLTEVPAYRNEILLPGILEKFDMPQVYQSLCPEKVTVLNPLSGDKQVANDYDIDELQKSVINTYRFMRNTDKWSVRRADKVNREQVIFNFFIR
jgi:dienelactone hydrolase